MGKQIDFRVQRCQKYRSYEERLEAKVVENSVSYNKLSERKCLSFPEVELGVRKIDIFEIV